VGALKIVAILLIALGVIGLLYGGLTYTRTTHEASVGPLELSIKDTETINVPVWAGVGSILVGTALFFVRTKQAQPQRA
jgi:TRAP-type C4-dicarboxylate transport system permease small subunit